MQPLIVSAPVRRSVRWGGLFAALSIHYLSLIVVEAADLPSAAQRPAKEPAQQVEKDWIDNRWGQTEMGPFLASTFPTPIGSIAKGLSIRLGATDPIAGVAYDTANMDLRWSWSGAFLHFPSVRFGINGAPTPAGPPLVTQLPTNSWQGGVVHYQSLHLNGNHVILHYRIGETAVSETPWARSSNGLTVVSREIEVSAHSAPLQLALSRTPEVSPYSLRRVDSTQVGVSASGEVATLIALKGDGLLSTNANSPSLLLVELAPAKAPTRIKLFLGAGPSARQGELETLALREESPSERALSIGALAEAGPAHWKPLEVRGQLGSGAQAYVIDTVTVPYNNPWKALFFTSGVDFLNDGTAFVCTLHGEVWKVDGIDSNLQHVTWHRFATGLFQPLGLRVVKDRVFVLGRDQITELVDRNHDGEADDYLNFSNLIDTSLGNHDYVTSLETDATGNFYYIDPIGVHRISADGSQKETLATGWRNPNGMSVGPTGVITATPQQGTWTPSSQISEVRLGGYYGFGGPKVSAERPLGYDAPLCWIPHSVDNSTGSQLWGQSDRWGPLNGQLLSLSFGRCALYLVLRETVQGQPQGGVIPLKGKFLSGSMRGSFNPKDGQLYVVGSQGWQTAAARDGCLQRVRYTGAPFHELIGLHSQSNGIRLTFTSTLDRSAAEDPGSYGVERWNYRYTSNYGSKDYSVAHPDQEGHDPMPIKGAKLLEDGKSVLLLMNDLRPVMQMHVKYNVNTAEGTAIRGDLYSTINALAPAE